MRCGPGSALPRGALKERRMRSRHLLAAWPACSEQVPVSTGYHIRRAASLWPESCPLDRLEQHEHCKMGRPQACCRFPCRWQTGFIEHRLQQQLPFSHSLAR